MRKLDTKRVKKEVDWNEMGAFFSTIVLGLFTLVRDTLKPVGVGLEFIPWLLKEGREALVAFLQEQGKQFQGRQEQSVLKLTGGRKVKILYATNELETRFAAVKPGSGRALQQSRVLRRSMTLAEMEEEFGPGVVTEADILATIRPSILPCDCAYFFFLADCVIRVYWSGIGLNVSAFPAGGPTEWRVGGRVFSRNFESAYVAGILTP